MSLEKTGLFGNYHRIAPYALAELPRLVRILALTVAASGLAVLEPWPLKFLVDYGLGGAAYRQGSSAYLAEFLSGISPAILVAAAAVASLFVAAFNIIIRTLLSWTWESTGQRMIYALAAELFARLQRFSLVFHVNRKIGDSLSRLTEDTWCVYLVTRGLLVTPAQGLLTLSALFVAGFSLDPGLALLSLVVAPAVGAGAFYFGQHLKQRTRAEKERRSELISFVHQTLGAIPVVQSFGSEGRNVDQFGRLSAAAVAASQRARLIGAIYAFFHGAVITGGVAIIIFASAQRVLAGAMTVGTMLVFIGYIRSMQGAAQELLTTFAELKPAEASLDRVMEILDEEDDLREASDAKPLPHVLGGVHIRIEDVTFGYDPSRLILQDVSLEVLPGETVAFVGRTGAGKSTLAAMLPRFFDPCSGRILVNGLDLRSVQLRSLREQVALVLQEPFLLPLTVAQNIAYGRPDASREDIQAAAAAANVEQLIRRLPNGYETVLGERGINLSGGEKQRIAIARALLKNAPLLILDEPTSALDVESEALVLDALERLMSGRTVIVIAHRFSTLRRVDRIVVLDQGKIIETGTHDKLLKSRGLYCRLRKMQGNRLALEVAQ